MACIHTQCEKASDKRTPHCISKNLYSIKTEKHETSVYNAEQQVQTEALKNTHEAYECGDVTKTHNWKRK